MDMCRHRPGTKVSKCARCYTLQRRLNGYRLRNFAVALGADGADKTHAVRDLVNKRIRCCVYISLVDHDDFINHLVTGSDSR